MSAPLSARWRPDEDARIVADWLGYRTTAQTAEALGRSVDGVAQQRRKLRKAGRCPNARGWRYSIDRYIAEPEPEVGLIGDEAFSSALVGLGGFCVANQWSGLQRG